MVLLIIRMFSNVRPAASRSGMIGFLRMIARLRSRHSVKKLVVLAQPIGPRKRHRPSTLRSPTSIKRDLWPSF